MWRSMLCCCALCSWDLISTHTVQSAPRRCLFSFEFLHIHPRRNSARGHSVIATHGILARLMGRTNTRDTRDNLRFFDPSPPFPPWKF
jgi:hypothetical protein